MSRAQRVLRRWLPIAFAVTVVSGLVYVAVQQVLRQDANDPQIQMAEDAAEVLARGGTLEAAPAAGKVDLARSLAPFVVVFDDKGRPVASSGQLHGKDPVPPAGVFAYVRLHGEDRVTWQPEPGVRIAVVVAGFTGSTRGFVLAGRSLKETERRESQAEMESGAAWIIALLSSLAIAIVCEFFPGNDKAHG